MKEIMNQEQMMRTLKRMTHEIIERNQTLEELILVGILQKGLPVAEILAENLKRFADVDIQVYGLNISNHRDDMNQLKKESLNTFNVEQKKVILVDDVLFTGRSVRAALDALSDLGRPKSVQLAVLIDRGHREIPIRADYTGKNLPTTSHEKVVVHLETGTVFIKA